MITKGKIMVFGALLLFGAAGCADLDVVNPNEPARGQVLRTASDMESLVSGSYAQWWMANYSFRDSPGYFLSGAAFQHSATAANQGMLQYSALPRVPIQNDPTNPDFTAWTNAWFRTYRGLAAVADGLRALEADTAAQRVLGARSLTRIRAHARFMQGLGHASIAVLFHEGFVVDETRAGIVDGRPADFGAPLGYRELMEAALGYWQQAITLAEAGGFDPIPAQWLGRATTPAQLAQLIRSLRAEYRVSLARTPEERQDVGQGGIVDWNAVLADIDRGVGEWGLDYTALGGSLAINDPVWDTWFWYAGEATWQQGSYFILGMADQSGMYQRWLARPIGERHPRNPEQFLIRTPDLRFPQGATVNEQFANPGRRWEVPDRHFFGNLMVESAFRWGQEARGTWRWSYYWTPEAQMWETGEEDFPWVSANRHRLIAAEAHYQLGNRARAAELINATRVGVGGLNPTDAAGTNTSCVPRLPNEQCGDLFEMLKWEQRMESYGKGPYAAAAYFDSRAWGDLYRGTPIDLPMPATEAVVLGLPVTTRGGVGRPGGAPQSNYAWPFE